MFVAVSRCHLRNCVCCVMVLPVFVTYVPESALFAADRATADVHETLVHVAYMPYLRQRQWCDMFAPARSFEVKKPALQA